MMKLKITCFIVLFLIVSVNLLNIDNFSVPESLKDEETSKEAIVSISSANIPGFQESSIFTDTTLSSGYDSTCAILDNGYVSCWGKNYHGELGDGTNTDRNIPTQTSSLGIGRTAVAISSGGYNTCAILDDGSVSCWGDNYWGQLGDGTTTDRNTPTQTSSLGTGRTAVAISSGNGHTCAILDDGSVSCWGYNDYQLGDGTTAHRNTPTQTSSLGTNRTAVAISSGQSHTCAILDDGTVSCWGSNYEGQLGDGTITDRLTPTQTASLGIGRTAVAISSGTYHTCAILDDGSVSCWGGNSFGQLGDGTTTDRNTSAQTSSLGTGRTAVAISSGSIHTCAILDDGSVSCWGKGSGQLGDGTSNPSTTPTQTSSLGTGRTAVAITSGTGHTCALLEDGTVSCWGFNYNGQLGDGTNTERNIPTQTSSLGTTTNPRIVALSERDFDGDGILNIFDSTSPSLVTCNAGQYGFYLCLDAPVGKYVASVGARFATDCAAGTYQATTGQTSCDDATAGHYVDPSLGTSQSTQTACLAGTYNPSTGSTNSSACVGADAGYYVALSAGNAQATQTACLAGTYNPSTASNSSSACLDADAGSYVSSTGQSTQTQCSSGTYQATTGQTSCDEAGAGNYVFSVGQSTQIPCPVGTYNPETGSIYSYSCIDSDEGHYVNSSLGTGQSTQTPCPSGTYSQDAGSTTLSDCIVTDAGHYANSSSGIGQTKQNPCSLGTYQAAIGQGACDDADIGYFVDWIGAHTQEECPKGEFQPLSGQSKCNLAVPGYYVSTTGQSNQTACAAGTYSNLSGSVECQEAGSGYYVLNSNRTDRIQCPLFTYTYVDENTSGNTSDELSDCWIDTDGDTLVDDDSVLNSDDDDDNDEFKDLVDAFPLNSSEWEDLNNDGVGDNQKPLNSFENMENVVGTTLSYAIIFLPIGIIVGIVLVLKSRKKSKVGELPMPVFESITTPLTALIHSEPPVPAEGLPIGWTMEQWTHYGEQWLSQNTVAAIPDLVQYQPSLMSSPQSEFDTGIVKELIKTLKEQSDSPSTSEE